MKKGIDIQMQKDSLKWIDEQILSLNRQKYVLKKACSCYENLHLYHKKMTGEIWKFLNDDYKLDGEERSFLKYNTCEPMNFTNFYFDRHSDAKKNMSVMKMYLDNYLSARYDLDNITDKMKKNISALRVIKSKLKQMSYFRKLVVMDMVSKAILSEMEKDDKNV